MFCLNELILSKYCFKLPISPGGTMVKNLPEVRETELDPWVRKILWSRKWQPTALFLPGKFHGQGSLAGYNPWGCRDADMIE